MSREELERMELEERVELYNEELLDGEPAMTLEEMAELLGLEGKYDG